MKTPKIYEGKDEIIPRSGDIIKFSSGSQAFVIDWAEDMFYVKPLHTIYKDRGWFPRLLEKWSLSEPQYEYENIIITDKAYLIGRPYGECVL